jgi:hypothetical protein
MKTNLHSLADASLGVFKPLVLDASTEALKKQLKDERELRIAAVRALADDSSDNEGRIARISELEAEVGTLRAQLASGEGVLASARDEAEQRRLALENAAELHVSLKDQYDIESRGRASAEAFQGAATRSLEEATKALETVRAAYLQSEARCTALTTELRRPVRAPEATPYEIELVRAGPGGDLHKLRLQPAPKQE